MNVPAHAAHLTNDPCYDAAREIRAPRGTELHCKSRLTEAAYRMLQNNLDLDVVKNPRHLVIYNGIGRVTRDWTCLDRVLETLRKLNDDESLLV